VILTDVDRQTAALSATARFQRQAVTSKARLPWHINGNTELRASNMPDETAGIAAISTIDKPLQFL
jgi:hypothetical protein